MFIKLVRKFHSCRVVCAAETSHLAKLRKKTGYTFANCKKALEMHNNDLEKAEGWLKEQAQALGWSKATKLSGRTTTQGLIALKYDESHAALVEINCETDFVAKNEKFLTMAEQAANACFKFAHTTPRAKSLVTKMCLDTEQLNSLRTPDGKTLSEQLVLMIGTVGENATLRRAECWKASNGLFLSGYTHPSISKSSFSAGKYGGIIAYKCDNKTEDVSNISYNLCKHVVGMNPSKIGDEEKDKPDKVADDEPCMIYQEYLSDPTMTVKDVLSENHIEIVDFLRFECGQNLDNAEVKEPLENVQTCQ